MSLLDDWKELRSAQKAYAEQGVDLSVLHQAFLQKYNAGCNEPSPINTKIKSSTVARNLAALPEPMQLDWWEVRHDGIAAVFKSAKGETYTYVFGEDLLIDDTKIIFSKLAEQWRQETLNFSNPHKILLHPAYLRIIGLGKEAVPFILEDLRKKGGHWFTALEAITGENPTLAEHSGSMKLSAEDWIKWGVEQGYIKE